MKDEIKEETNTNVSIHMNIYDMIVHVDCKSPYMAVNNMELLSKLHSFLTELEMYDSVDISIVREEGLIEIYTDEDHTEEDPQLDLFDTFLPNSEGIGAENINMNWPFPKADIRIDESELDRVIR